VRFSSYLECTDIGFCDYTVQCIVSPIAYIITVNQVNLGGSKGTSVIKCKSGLWDVHVDLSYNRPILQILEMI